ncbi:MAG: hypothetical protein BIP78_0326 [Candidatus Bipolaricaulis sibiricus]|uniref:Cation-transporting P-type ATPase N-terminal domain-containing protein n=1 Tax=Bipolaricaulis sibiricus TaxID=2501609 RepID=A0A410FSX9_BIPS1|nr:MAG: hypothetical protein BIP78_0326 [Candidatus Bipolaricaulis sibiricus]
MRDGTPQRAWHALAVDEVLQSVKADREGLATGEIPHRLERFGRNALEAERATTPLQVLAHQLHHPLIYLLLGAAVVSVVAGHAVDAIVIGGVVVLNTILGAMQEWRADKALEALHRMASPHARVRRDGQIVEVDASEVVPGDILLLETGDRVAADARVLEATDLTVDESALTGESEPVTKAPGVLPEETPLADRTNMVWSSTAVTGGRGLAVVVATGMHTALGKVAARVRETGREQTPLQRRLARLGTVLGVAGIALAGLMFLVGLLKGFDWLEMVLFSVAVAVSAIPEGLPAVISVTLALGVQRMARRHAIIRRLPAVETLGSTTVICSDKTGTITRNEMTVTALWTRRRAYEVTGSGFAPDGEIRATGGGNGDGLDPGAELLLQIGALCNNAGLVQENGAWRVRGTPTEGALVVAARKGGIDLEKLAGERPRLAEVPFSSDRKYMATLHPGKNGGGPVVYVKGAPDRVLAFCTRIVDGGDVRDLTDDDRREIEETIEAFAGRALRVVAGAVREFPGERGDLAEEDVESALTFVGLWGMVDPPRPEAIQAIADAQGAGIRVVMITGDHKATAAAIAHEVGIIGHGEEAITGTELDAMSDEDLARRVQHVGVFARVTPAHKLRILQALKAHGEVVAMTGDGVNDAPALKGADIGVAMGRAGTEVAKESSDMILTDDNFATIVHAVEEGRVIFANLRRVVFFLITTNLGEILTLTAALVVGLPLPLTAIMILWINLVTDGACTIPLGLEPKHRDVLQQPPRPPREGVLNLPVVRRMFLLAPVMAAGTLGLFAYELRTGTVEHAMTVAFAVLASFQWFQALNARASRLSVFSLGLFSNRALWVGIGIAVALQLLVVYTPLGHMLFGTVSLTASDWLKILAVGGSILVVDEVLKALGVHGKRPTLASRGPRAG